MIREIEKNDYHKGYMNLVNVFTKTPIMKTYDEFCKIVDIITLQNSKIYVIEKDGLIVSTLKIIIEQKLHNNFACVAHIEDVVTYPDYRGKGYASQLIEYAKNIGIENNCYKIVLCCNDNNISYYEKCGFIQKGEEMCLYLNI